MSQDDHYAEHLNLPAINIKAVDSLCYLHDNLPEEFEKLKDEVAIPFIQQYYASANSDEPYKKPSYWGALQEKYLGQYSGATFANISAKNGVTTSSKYDFYKSDEANLKDVNKKAVTNMMIIYNDLWRQYLPPREYKAICWVPMLADAGYEINMMNNTLPSCWMMDYQIPGYASIKEWYGLPCKEDLSDVNGKLPFMIDVMLKREGSENFFLYDMFPVEPDPQMSGNSIWAEGGEEKIKELYELFTTEYNKNPESHDFTFPEKDIKLQK